MSAMVGTRWEAAQYAALSLATNVPNAAQCVAGTRIGSELAEDRMLQALARRTCHREPVVDDRPEDDAAAEGRLAAAARALPRPARLRLLLAC